MTNHVRVHLADGEVYDYPEAEVWADDDALHVTVGSREVHFLLNGVDYWERVS